jgi:prevent-host-death family protein
MSRVGVRELKNQATEIIRAVREDRAEYVITYHGRPVAVLMPLEEGWLEGETREAVRAASSALQARAEMEALRQEIARGWTSEQTAVEVISEQRR